MAARRDANLPAAQAKQRETQDELREVLASCTPRQREVLEQLPLYHGKLWSCAKAMKVSQDTVSRWTREARFRKARELMTQLALDAIGVNIASVLGTVASIANADARNLFDETGALKPVRDFDDDNAAAIESIEVDEIRMDGVVVGQTRKVRRTPRLKAAELLGRHLRLWGEERPAASVPALPALTVVVQQVQAGGGASAAPAGYVVASLGPPIPGG